MRYPRNNRMKKLIYLEMIVLSVLLVVAVVVVSRLKQSDPYPNQPQADTQTSSVEETNTTPTEPAPTWKTFPDGRQLTAPKYFAYDCNTQSFLVKSGYADTQIYPANITKLFTALTIIETSAVGPNSIITVGEDMLALVPPNSPVAHMQAGDRVTGRQLMEGMLINDGDDAAYILVCQAGRNLMRQPTLEASAAVQAFMEEMNRHLQEKGMRFTNLTNPIGTHESNHLTAFQDLVILGNLCMQYNTIMDPAIVPEADTRLHGETIIWNNANQLINKKSEYYCPYATGLKTGNSQEAGNCLLSVFEKGSQYFIIGVFGCPTPGDSFDDTLQLFNQICLK